MIHLISLNELTLPRFLALALARQPVKVLRIAPFVPKAKGLLKRVTEWAIRTGRAEYAVKLAPELEQYWEFERRFYFQEVFTKYEPWQNHYYGFERHDIAGDPIYGYSYKQMTCSYTYWKVIEVYLLDAITRKLADGEYRVYGVLEDTLALGRDRFGDSFARNVAPMAYPRFVVRACFMLLSAAFTLVWLASRIRLSVKTKKIDIAFERLNDPRDLELFREISDAGRFLIIYRSKENFDAPEPLPEELDYSSCLRTDGLFSPSSALVGASMAVRDIFRLARRHKDAPPALLYEMLSLPFKRLLIKGLLNRCRPDYFISRDEYNVDHILRRVELNALGIKSIGISNGLFPSFSTLSPNIRYVSFDTYFVFGAPFSTQYHDTWAPDMDIRSIMTYSVPRVKMLFQKKPREGAIVFTMRVAWNEPTFVPIVRAVATAFPERTVYVQFKRVFVSQENAARLAEECSKGLDNVHHTTENVYALVDRAKYHISDLSSIVIEAIAMGMSTFVADLIDMEYTCFRQFPGLCVTSGEELVSKLRALETGEATYPRQEYFKLLGCNQNETTYDLIRKEIGLPSKADPPATARVG